MAVILNRYYNLKLSLSFLYSSGLGLLLLTLFTAPLAAREGDTLASTTVVVESSEVSEPTQNFLEVGRGEMDWLWFSLYKAKLMTLTGRYQQGQYPLLLDIEYYRDIAAEDLLQATREQWQHLLFSADDIERWQSLLTATWPDVKPGDHLSFKAIDEQTSQFFFNQQPLGVMHDANFAAAFLAIWLSKDTSRPSLRAQLLGEKSCDC
ncbi:chalcone isomerase family protein [Shewanella morhuae]|uniref:chalcone isomerase family protein n=1 Tax=Shewanella morhuae TaxID=365591 RepID=UPI001BB894B4|nr:chalcone isomerase family protein [Shewanella morhuae]GIU04323.1 hypothetical protein TUM4641_12180 [Shewanella morhuae]